MYFKPLIVFCLALFLMFSCAQDPASAPESNSFLYNDETTFPSTKTWSAEEVQDYFANFAYPENPYNYKLQFYNDRHRSQLRADELAEVLEIENGMMEHMSMPIATRKTLQKEALQKPRGGSGENSIQSYSSTFWFCGYYASYDWGTFNTAVYLYGDQVYWYSSQSEYGENTNYMTNYINTMACKSYVESYCSYSYIGTYDSDSGLEMASSDLPSGDLIIWGGFLKQSAGSGEKSIQTVPGGYVASNLYPSFENWTSGFPTNWQPSISSPYNIPTAWNTQFPSANVVQNSTYKKHGSYSAAMTMDRSRGKSLSSKYFHIPETAQMEGIWGATIWVYGETQSIELSFQITYYDSDDDIIETVIMEVDGGSSSFERNLVESTYLNTDVHYVRFAFVQTGGRTTDTVYLDALSLYNFEGDVSLPVEFDTITEDPEWEAGNECWLEWRTFSELENAGFELWYIDDENENQKASDDFCMGSGNKSSATIYDYQFDLNSAAVDLLWENGYLEVFIVSKSYSGEREYHDDPADVKELEAPLR